MICGWEWKDLDALKSYLDGHVSRDSRGGAQWTQSATLAGRTQRRKMIRSAQDLSLGAANVFLAPSDDKHRLLIADRGLDVGVGLGTQGFDLATWEHEREQLLGQYPSHIP